MTFTGGMATIAVIAAKHAKCSRTRTLTAAGSTAVPPPGHPAPGSGGRHARCPSWGYFAALATRNLKDFRHTGVDLINPWQGA